MSGKINCVTLKHHCNYSDLNEASLLWNLKIRYDKELIYVCFFSFFPLINTKRYYNSMNIFPERQTYTGSILVAVNPYKMFDIYGLDQVKLYEGRILGTLPP